MKKKNTCHVNIQNMKDTKSTLPVIYVTFQHITYFILVFGQFSDIPLLRPIFSQGSA